ncbi:hypothetical protein C5B97_10905 [Pseudoclavibacter sp. RFBB5]|nr:hypothetical protein C5B97_10905 [Pseudoclavibacter sp. RFBB5]
MVVTDMSFTDFACGLTTWMRFASSMSPGFDQLLRLRAEFRGFRSPPLQLRVSADGRLTACEGALNPQNSNDRGSRGRKLPILRWMA